MTQTADLLAIAVDALKGATDAGDRVYSALTWPTVAAQYPMVYCKTPTEDKESISRSGPPQFTVTATLKIEAREKVGALPNGQSAAQLEMKLARLNQQIQVALINNPKLMGQIQRFSFVRSDMALNAVGDQEMGEVEVSIGLEFYQGPEDFYDLPVYPITEAVVKNDLVNVFDPTGTFTDPPFSDAATAAPRTHGPDGRAEGGLTIPLNTEV